MIARLHVLLPFSVQVPEGEPFTVYSYVEDGYDVRVYPPVKSEMPASAGTVDQLQINGRPAESYNALRIDFHREKFDRLSGLEADPSYDFIAKAVNSFLSRLRHVTRSSKVRPVNFPRLPWRLQYLNDDGTELVKEEGLVRGRGALEFSLDFIGITKEVWNDIHDLEPDFQASIWNDLLLDAHHTLPQIGPTLVLAATALEVFIAQILDSLAKQSSIPKPLWTWLNTREWLRAPTIEEQFDVLLNVLCGYSLKQDQELWEPFMNLKTARNTFVHEGVAKIGGTPVTEEDSRRLLSSATKIIQAVRERLPEELQWKEYTHECKVSAQWKFFGDESKDTTAT